jgi:hypothetical protein
VLDRIGYVFNGLGKFEEALGVYQSAEAFSVKKPSQRPYRVIALGGMSFSSIELNRLDKAERAFEIDPMNAVALNELAYIKNLRSPK